MEDSMLVELSFMVIIILGRWLLPKGNVSHSALSQLLLVYLSLASDILDLLTLFSEKEIYRSFPMVHAVLTVFSLCMLQFTLNLTATRGRAFYAEFDDNEFEIYQSASCLPPPPRSALSQHKKFERLLPQTTSSSTIRPLATTTFNLTPRSKPRASSVSLVIPPDTIFENAAVNGSYEMNTSRNTTSKFNFIFYKKYILHK